MGKISDTIRYEFETSLGDLTKYDTWIFLTAIFCLIMVLYKEAIMAVLLLIVILVLNSAKNYKSGKVTDYIRKKYKKQAENESTI